MRTSDIHASVCLPLLEYCLSDLQFPLPSETSSIWSEFNGLPLLPLEDGSVGVIRVNQRSGFVLGTFNQVQLLAPRADMFVSLEARQRLHAYFSDSRFVTVMGLTHFSIKTLSDHIDQVLPSTWRSQDVVDWDPEDKSQIDRLWLHRFWQEVRFERRSLGYFRLWPLIPVKGSRLITCGKPDAAICVWRESGDPSIIGDVSLRFNTMAKKHEEKLADLERERRELIELSKRKLLSEELIEHVSDAEDDIDGEAASDFDEEGKNGDDAIKQEQASAQDQQDALASDADAPTDVLPAAGSIDIESGSRANEPSEPAEGRDLMDAEDAASRFSEHGEAVLIDMVEEVADVEYCSRETLHSVLTRLNAAMIELSFFSGQESDMVPSSRDMAISVLDCLSTSEWSGIKWSSTNESDAMFLAEFFSFHSNNHGGFNRMHLDMLKKLPIFVNICHETSSIDTGEFYLVPSEIDLATIPLPPNARQSFLKMNQRLTGFYRDLGVQEMSYAKLLIFLLPMYSQLTEEQCDIILGMIRQKWPTLRGDSELTSRLKGTALFRDPNGVYQPASAFFDPRNKVLATIYRAVPEQFPTPEYHSFEWLDLMGEIGLVSEITVDVFIGCAQRIEALLSNKRELIAEDETLAIALHQYFIQNFERFDRSRNFFETISHIAFVPAVCYDYSASTGSFNTRTVIVKYSECATPDDQALVFTSKPVLLSSVVPPRILWSRLSIVSPPEKDAVLAHLFHITDGTADDRSPTMQWQFYLPMVEVFQEMFKYLQNSWETLRGDEQRRIADAAIVPIGSSLVKGSRLYFHLGENLAPLMYEVPRAYGAYDTLFRRLGSKDTPEIEDYVALLQDLHAECGGKALNLNELVAVSRIVNLLADMLADNSQSLSTHGKKSIHLPSTFSVMQPVLQMAYNDAPWLCARINLSALHVVHPRISSRWCQSLGVRGISAIVTEELGSEAVETLPACNTVAHFNSVLASQQFGNGVRKIITVQQQKATLGEPFSFIPDFDDINRRIVMLEKFEIKYVDTLQSRFVAKLEHPARQVDVTKSSASMSSLAFLDQSAFTIYVAKRTLEAQNGLRLSQVVASCINQVLGGILQEYSSVESILTCDVLEIESVLQLMNVCEDTGLIVEKLRGVVGEPLAEADQAAVELAPLSSHFPGELVAVELAGQLQYAKIVQEEKTDAGMSNYEVKVSKSQAKWYPSSQIFTFRTARQGSSSTSEPSASGGRREAAAVVESIVGRAMEGVSGGAELPASLSLSTASQSSHSNALGVVPASNVVAAVNDMLSRFNISLSSEYEELLQENLRLRQRLEQAEEGRRVASAQIDDAIREKKDAQDSLVCAICLENKVDRVLIPCGHIYCGECVERLPRPSCPICRQHIASSSTFHVPS